ncbi:MAG: YjbH domain-containing protein [candidate division Zixibacteria bacterium]|nr:YjbH domain-containing protein [candidate division Zixibacteria bacterium]
MKMKVILFCLVFIFIMAGSSLAQYQPPPEEQKHDVTSSKVTKISGLSTLSPRKLIDCPTAALLPRGSFDFDIRFFPNGGVNIALGIGLMKRLNVGMSYGGEEIIGDKDPNWNPRIEFAVKYRLINESYMMPAFALGFDSQGYGAYDDSLDRYANKSKGFYGVISKNYLVFEQVPVGLHFGGNYSLENEDKDKSMDLYLGADVRITEDLAGTLEYDLAFNDNRKDQYYGRGYGYLNIGIQWIFQDRLVLELDLKNVLRNKPGDITMSREVRMVYVEYF